jgi:hypothetical protein
MQEDPEPTFVKQIQEAVDRGQVVLVPTLGMPPGQRPTPTTPPQRDRDETSLTAALCLMFGLRRTEGQILMQLATQDYLTKAEIFAAAAQSGQAVKISTISVLISVLRKKLGAYDIELVTLRGLGWGLHKTSRAKICRRLAKYDAGLIPTSPRSKSKVSEPDLFEPKFQARGRV